jgi:hypothetical protein
MTAHFSSTWTLAEDPPPTLMDAIAKAVASHMPPKRFDAYYIGSQAEGFICYLTMMLRKHTVAEARALVAAEKPKAEWPEHFEKLCNYVLDYMERERTTEAQP